MLVVPSAMGANAITAKTQSRNDGAAGREAELSS